jgi:methyl-accepting chemotaxis protein
MMADANYDIVYMNDSVQEMMRIAESDLKMVLPNFNANALLGESIDVFHKNPAHQRGMLESLRTQYKGQISVGSRTFDLIATPIFDNDHNRLGTVVEWDDITEKLALEQAAAKAANDNTRIKLALDVCSTNVMMADHDYNICYMNESVQAMMKAAEADLKAELSRFDANNLLGNNIDIFHKNPAHQRSMLEKLSGEYKTTIKVGPRTF